MIVWNVIDESFKHDIGIVAGKPPKNVTWNRGQLLLDRPTFYCNQSAADDTVTPAEQSFFLLNEPKSILGYNMEIMSAIINKFKLVFTHDSRYLRQWPEKCRWIPGGGIWIGGTQGGGSIGLKEKSKLCSLVASHKVFCPLHKFRAELANSFRNSDKVDVLGNLFGGPWLPINESLDPYYFSIIIENSIDELYFTEKLLNCFATGTVPVYVGASKIHEVFDHTGIIYYETKGKTIAEGIDWFHALVRDLTPEMYHYKLPGVINNLALCQEFETIEDFILAKYGQEIE